ncbi:hypothetical protein AB0K51_05105 [Kitasatospora sp. NPDC049285]|uniref:hypothetical protein n=1 Tax=Kitasatospora sp. NPDC049285 TaxID=3157096 RepID=UPI0034407F58
MTLAVAVPRPLPSPELPLWLVTMPTSGPDGGRGEQTFAVRAASHPAALAEAAATAQAHPALRHRRGAGIDLTAATAVRLR